MEGIINLIIALIMIWISVILYNTFYAKLNNHRLHWNIKNILLSIITASIVLFSNMLFPMYIKVFCNFICLNIELKIVFKDKWKKIIINYICIYFVFIFLEILLTKLLFITGILENSTSANSINYINLILSIMIGIIQYSIVVLKPTKILIQNMIKFFLENKPITIITFLISMTITIIGMIYIENFTNKNTFRFIILLIIIFAILFILVIKSKYNEELLKTSNEKLIDYNDKYGKFLDEYKIYKHNIKNKLISLKSYGNERVKKLIDDLLEEETEFAIRNNNIYNIPNGIKGIVAEKLYNKDYNVFINNKIKGDPFIKLNPRTFNSVSESLGIALDNAIEASKDTHEPIILMDLNENKDNILIKVGNNYSNNIDLTCIGNKYYSTKNRDSGLGLFSIFRNNLIHEKIDIINDFYYIELKIKKQKRK